MDWQVPSDSQPTAFVTEAAHSTLRGTPPVTGAWQDGDHPGNRRFCQAGPLDTETGGHLPHVRLAYEVFGEPNAHRSNVILLFHALTGDSHAVGPAGPGHVTSGWWPGVIGPGEAIDTDQWCVVVPNILGGCQGSTGPSTPTRDGREWGARFPYLTIRDQVRAVAPLADELGVATFASVMGGSMGGMHALEWGLMFPERTGSLGLIASSAVSSADQVAANSLQLEAIRNDPYFSGGDYYDQEEGPYRGLALARRLALMNYRSPWELNDRFDRSWQTQVSPIGDRGRFAVESYLDFHGNKFTRRFDANSYLSLVGALNSHDVGRDRGDLADVLGSITVPTLVLGIDSDRCFPIDQQQFLADHIPTTITEGGLALLASPYGHDGFLIESDTVGHHISHLLEHVTPA
jgi:homoserine O-acetyltransferase